MSKTLEISSVNVHLGLQEQSRPKEVVIYQVQIAQLFIVFDNMWNSNISSYYHR
jgi:hypothetical protein